MLEISMGEWSYEDSGPNVYLRFQKTYECHANDLNSYSEHIHFMDSVSKLQCLS